MNSKPFTYYLHWSAQNKSYYGVRFAVGCDPKDLWRTYFTSSKHVKKFVAQFGDPDVIEIRKRFSLPEAAIRWEHKVLRRLKVLETDAWLNECIGNGIFISSYRQPKSEKHRQRMADANRLKAADPTFREKMLAGMRNSEAFQAAKRKPKSDASNDKRRSTMIAKPRITCVHCHRDFDAGNYKKNHGDNCKLLAGAAESAIAISYR